MPGGSAFLRFIVALTILASLPRGAASQNAPPKQGATPLSITRFVPGGIDWDVSFYAALNPDCSLRNGAIASARLVTKPQHGSVGLIPGEEFPQFPNGTSRAACNEKRVRGLRVTYTSE